MSTDRSANENTNSGKDSVHEDKEYTGVFDVSSEYDQPVYTGEGSFDNNLEYCKRLKGKSNDILIRCFILADGRRCAVIMVDGMSSKDTVEQSVLLASRRMSSVSGVNKFDGADGLLQQFAITEYSKEKSLSKGYISALTGDVLVIIEGEPEVFVFGYRSIESRSVDESPNEGSVRGPHEAFTENLRTNTALLRRRISDPNFVIEHLKVGQRSHTTVTLCYILGLTRPELVDEIRKRIKAIDIDIINDSGELEQLLEDKPGSLFPQIAGSEMPDTVAAELCNGRAAILVNGSPQALMLPATLSRLMKVNEDNYQRWSFASFVKLLRWLALIIAVIGPAAYVAMVSYHPGMLPTDLLIITAINRLNVPFSAFTEVVIIELVLELLREASIRMPKSIGTALSIVGGIIIGDAAISAGLISPLLIIIAGLTALAGFTIPSYSLASSIRLVKYAILLLSAFLGLVGLVIGLVLWVSVMVSTSSFGTDFTAPFAPLDKHGLVRGLIELPLRRRVRRPQYLDPLDTVRYRPQGMQREE